MGPGDAGLVANASKIAGIREVHGMTALGAVDFMKHDVETARLRMTALADYLGLEKSTISGLVDRAERRGLLERALDASDGRAVEVYLSAGGMELAGRLESHVAQSLSPLTGTLTPGRASPSPGAPRTDARRRVVGPSERR